MNFKEYFYLTESYSTNPIETAIFHAGQTQRGTPEEGYETQK